MTATATMTDPTLDPWTRQLAQLRERHKHVRPAILAAMNVLLTNKDISADDAKAQAELHGVRITAASLNAARTLLSRMDTASTPVAPVRPKADAPTAVRATRRQRTADNPVDAETLIRGVVSKLQTQGNAEAERLREGIRKAIAVLQAAVG